MPKANTYPVTPPTAAARLLGVTDNTPDGELVLFEPTALGSAAPANSTLAARTASGTLAANEAQLGTEVVNLDQLNAALAPLMGTPNFVGTFDEAKIAQIVDDGDAVLVVPSPDARVNNTTPPPIAGDMTGNMLRYLPGIGWSIIGRWQGDTGKSAYQIAVDNGFIGTETDWLTSLDGKSAYQVAVDNGFVGTQSEWLLTLKGDSLRVNEWGVVFNEAKIAAIEALTDEYVIVIAQGGDQRADNAQPAELVGDGDLERQLLIWTPSSGLWFSNGVFTGVEGPRGKAGIPDEQGTLTAAKLAAIQTAGTDWLYAVTVDGDLRPDKNIPASLPGDQSRMLISYNALAATFSVVGQWTGPDGPIGDPDESGILNEAKITEIQTAAVDWRFAVDDDQRVDQNLPAPLAGSVKRWLLEYKAATSTWRKVSIYIGQDGAVAAKGAPGTPDYIGPLNEALVNAIQTAIPLIDRRIVASTDVRINKNLPSNLAGDQTYNMIEFDSTTSTWSVIGRWQGEAGSLIPVYDVFIAHPTGVAAGGYPLTSRVRVPANIVEFWGRTGNLSDDTVQVIISVNGIIAHTATLTEVMLSETVAIAVGYGDRIVLNVLQNDAPTPMPKYIECGLSV